jgi:hypothetical protein
MLRSTATSMSLALNLNNHLILRKNKITKWILKELATRYVPRELAFQPKHPVWSVPVDKYFVPMLRSPSSGRIPGVPHGYGLAGRQRRVQAGQERPSFSTGSSTSRCGGGCSSWGSRSTTFRPCSSKRTYGPTIRGSVPHPQMHHLTAISRLRDPRRWLGL